MLRHLQQLVYAVLVTFVVSTANASANQICRHQFSVLNAQLYPEVTAASGPIRFASFNVMKAGEKRQDALAAIGGMLLAVNADIVALQEIASKNAAVQLVQQYLGNNYQIVFYPGPQGRNINNAVLIHHRLPFAAKVYNTALPLVANSRSPLFNRGLPIILFKALSGNTSQDFVFFNLHLKSQINRVGHPPAADERVQQILALDHIMERISVRFSRRIILAGDFNADLANIADGTSEYLPFLKRGLRNAFDIARDTEHRELRYTQVYLPKNAPAIPQQLDGFLVDPDLFSKILRVKIIRSFPDQKLRMKLWHGDLDAPSDHDLVVMDLE